jgi:NAD(P) transhydrogenase
VFRRHDRRLLGVHIIGDIASELIALGQATLHNSGTIDVFNNLTFATPTYTMAYKYAAFDGFKRLAAAGGLQTFEFEQKRDPVESLQT